MIGAVTRICLRSRQLAVLADGDIGQKMVVYANRAIYHG